jgi:hypothetical protein
MGIHAKKCRANPQLYREKESTISHQEVILAPLKL